MKKIALTLFAIVLISLPFTKLRAQSVKENCSLKSKSEQAQCFEQLADKLVTQLHKDKEHLHYRDDDEVLQAYALAIQAYQTHDGESSQGSLARVYYALGSLLVLQEKHADAVNALAKAVAILDRIPTFSPLLRAQATIALGVSHARLEIFALAQVHARNALTICEQSQLSLTECKLPAQAVITEVYRVVQDFYRASETYQSMQAALNVEAEKDNIRLIAIRTKQLAAAAQIPNQAPGTNHGDLLRNAILALEKYQRMLAENSDSLDIDAIENQENLARLYLKSKQPATALLHARQALDLREKSQGKYAQSLVASFNLIAQCYLATQDVDKAYEALKRAISLYWYSTSLRLRSESFDLLSQVLQLKGNPQASIFYSKRALTSTLFAGRKIRLADPALGRYLVASRPELFRTLASKLFDAARLVEGEYVLRFLKENEFQDFKHEFGDAMSDSEENEFEAPLKQQLYLIRAKLNPYEPGIPRAVSTFAEPLVSNDTKLLQRRAFETDMELHFERISKHLHDIEIIFLSASAQQQIPSEQTQQASDDKTRFLTRAGNNTALLQYLVTNERSYVLVHTAHDLKLHKIEISKVELERQVRHFLNLVKNPKLDPRIAGQSLYKLLLEPAERDLPPNQIESLLFSLDGPLMSLPMSALYDGMQYIAQRYSAAQYSPVPIDISVDPVRANPLTATYKTDIALLGTSQARAGFPALKGVKEELASLQKLSKTNHSIRSHFFMDNDFTEQRLQRVTEQHIPYIHIASHHYLNTNDADTSFLLLGDGKKLSISDLKSEKFDFTNVELLTLSACNTATTSRQVNGLAMEGLGLVLQKRGAKSILASKWAIDDLSTATFMHNFYQQLFLGTAKAKALRQAQVQFMQEESVPNNRQSKTRGAERQRMTPNFVADKRHPFAHPYFWAGFVLMGEWQ